MLRFTKAHAYGNDFIYVRQDAVEGALGILKPPQAGQDICPEGQQYDQHNEPELGTAPGLGPPGHAVVDGLGAMVVVVDGTVDVVVVGGGTRLRIT